MKQIPLTQGKFAIVDEEDFEWLSQYKWAYHKGYAISRSSKLDPVKKYTYMHRLLCKTPPDLITDHINGDGLDNRKENLRIANFSQNAANTAARQNKHSRYKGVCWSKQHQKWEAYIFINGKRKYIGHFKSEENAANAYNIFASKHFGEFAKLNNVPLNENWESTQYYRARGGSSNYRGVHFHKLTGKWEANLTVNRKRIHLGLFEHEIEAAKAYNKAVIKHGKSQTLLNQLDRSPA